PRPVLQCPSLSSTTLRLFFLLLIPRPPTSTLFPYTTLFRSDDVHRPRLVERGGPEIVFRQDDEAPLLVLVALDEIFPGDRLPIANADPLELDRGLVGRVQHPELRAMVANRRVQLDRNVDEAERNRTFPECSSHEIQLLRFSSFSASNQSSK